MRNRKMWYFIMLLAAAGLLQTFGCGRNAEERVEREVQERVQIRFYGEVIDYPSGPLMTEALVEKCKNQIDVVPEVVDWGALEEEIIKGITSGQPSDIYQYPIHKMKLFCNMALDLTPYVQDDPEFASRFRENEWQKCMIDGKILIVPWEYNFPVVLANRELLSKAGVEIPDSWRYEDFCAECEKIKALGIYPFANSIDRGHGSWLYRNAILSTTLSAGTYEEYKNGNLSFEGEENREALESIKTLYDKGYMFPGEGAATAGYDEIKAAFLNGELAMMTDAAAGAVAMAKEAEENGVRVCLVPWPAAGEADAVHSGDNGLFIPKNCKNPDAAMEVIKEFTDQDIQSIHAEYGYIPANTFVETGDEMIRVMMDQTRMIYAEDPPNRDMETYRGRKLIPELILGNGTEAVMEQMEQIRLQAE